ncbi:MAG TPA: NADH-quinone oxidoreductase subunit NuoH [Terriglobia bacterium]|jgi:NADH-quinone oxidoreductase subunit H|nr:NADH-quinone oxidoreductase subunit NuoH [Terriglobia bacterium]
MATFSDTEFFLIETVIKIALIIFILLTAIAYLTWLERKVIAHIQSRWGPYLVGPHGLLQPLADGLKFMFKEDIAPLEADSVVYWLAPFLAFLMAFLSIAVIPFGESFTLAGHVIQLQITDLNVGLLFVFAVTSLGVYSVALAGWSSNSKYPLLGGLRSSAQMISYEVSLSLGVIGVLMIAGTLSLREIVNQQARLWAHAGVFSLLPRWNLFLQPLGFLIYFIAAIAETNRIPFDLPEGETELVAGFHTEYSSFKFAIFFMSEYANMVTVSAIATLLFFGGWLGPSFGPYWLRVILPVLWFCLKLFCFLFFYIWVRGTLPRFRYDQLMAFGWKVLLPLGLLNILVTSFVIAWVHS